MPSFLKSSKLARARVALCAFVTFTCFVSAASQQEKQVYEQCGGRTAAGSPDAPWPAAKCAAGLSCSRKDEWYWSCIKQDEAAAPAAPSSTGTTSASSSRRAAQEVAPAGAAAPGSSGVSAAALRMRDLPLPGPRWRRTGRVNIWSRGALDAAGQPVTEATAAAAAGGAAGAGGAGAGAGATGGSASCPSYVPTATYRKTDYTDFLNTTVSVHPRRPNADKAAGEWIVGRATFYGTDQRIEASRTACGEPEGQFGVLEYGSCGYTDQPASGAGSISFPREVYAAVADANADFSGSCGRCYEIRCKTGVPQNNGRDLQVSDLLYYRPYQLPDYQGRDWPGNDKLTQDLFHVRCWDNQKTVTVRIGDSCPCKYPIKATGEIRTQFWCCGGNNHFDLSFWAFEQLAHPSYGVMPIEYRPVDCDSAQPIDPLPGFVSSMMYDNGIKTGWGWRPYFAKNTRLRAEGEGPGGRGAANCATLSENGAIAFFCRECSKPSYQPFTRGSFLAFSIKSNTKTDDPYASSTPRGKIPPLKIFMMNDEGNLFCSKDVKLSDPEIISRHSEPTSADGWTRFKLPLRLWDCGAGSSVGGLDKVNRVDFQNIKIRDADVCLDKVAIVGSAGEGPK